MEVVVSFPSHYTVNVIGQDWSRPNEDWKKTAGKDFLSKGAFLIVIVILLTSFLITMTQYNHKNKHTMKNDIFLH